MPVWTDKSSHCESAQNEWNRFYGKLDEHENGHVAIYQGWTTPATVTHYLKNIEEKSECIAGTPTEAQIQAVKAAATAAVESALDNFFTDHNNAQKQFDNDTNHGVNTGAYIDTSKDCQ